MPELAIVIPLINEYPQALFTLRSVYEEVKDLDCEIIVVDNHCPEMPDFCGEPDKGHTHIPTMCEKVKWFRYLKYNKVCSHWQAKDYAVANSDANYFLFLDAHIVPGRESISGMFSHYKTNYDYLHGTLHLPLTYHILETQRLRYRFVYQQDKWFLTYKFENLQSCNDPTTEVPCMSMCGCLISKEIYDAFGGWGPGYSIYGGGENDANFTLATLGWKHWLYNPGTLFHYGEKRGYQANQLQIVNNRAIAAYKYGGEVWLKNYLICSGIPPLFQVRIEQMVKDVYSERRKNIEEKQVISIEEFIERWNK